MRYNKYAPYLYCKRGIYYFARRVPKIVQAFYNRPKIVLSLKTRSLRTARLRAMQLAQELEREWANLIWQSEKSALDRFRKYSPSPANSSSRGPALSKAKRIYLEQNLHGRPKTFQSSVERCVASFIGLIGDKGIREYSREDINTYRDFSLERGMAASSVRRNINTLRALVNFVSREKGLGNVECFSSVHIQDPYIGVSKRMPIPPETISKIQKECFRHNDEPRWLIALLSDTGMRLSEAVGLEKAHIWLSGESPYLEIRKTPHRRLKNASSERNVPLVGAALWAVKRAMEESRSEFLFPRYASRESVNSNSASATLNKWLKPKVPENCVIHSFRHSMRDRLRAAGAPEEVGDQIGGWAQIGIGRKYGEGHSMVTMTRWLNKIVEKTLWSEFD